MALMRNKCVSERHYAASQVKMTAGEAAKSIAKRVGKKVLAKEVKCLYLAHYGREPEWHHSGFYEGAAGRTMGRTFFLSEEEVQAIADNYAVLVQKCADEQLRRDAELQRKREARVTGFYWTWDYDYGGRYGRKQTFKVLHTYEGDELHQPAHFTACSPELLTAVKAKEGKRYYGWDEPSIDEFITL